MVGGNRRLKPSSRCAPRGKLPQFPAAWGSNTCWCKRHRMHLGTGHLHPLRSPDTIGNDLTHALQGGDGQPLSPPALRVLLVVMMLQLREPRATLWPFPFPEATGDIIEAAMGLCLPWQEAHKEFRAQFAETWGFQLADFASLHTKLGQ
eukprot:5017781-Pyramimonas_sp.AAC.1